jgi:hypothetical protein
MRTRIQHFLSKQIQIRIQIQIQGFDDKILGKMYKNAIYGTYP